MYLENPVSMNTAAAADNDDDDDDGDGVGVGGFLCVFYSFLD